MPHLKRGQFGIYKIISIIAILVVVGIFSFGKTAPVRAASGLNAGSDAWILNSGDNLFYGDFSASSSVGSNAILIQKPAGTNLFKIDSNGNTLIGGNLSVGGGLNNNFSNNQNNILYTRTSLILNSTFSGINFTGWSNQTPSYLTESIITDSNNGFSGTVLRWDASGGAQSQRDFASAGAQTAEFILNHTYRISFKYRAGGQFTIQDRDSAITTVPGNTGQAKFFSYDYTKTVDTWTTRDLLVYLGNSAVCPWIEMDELVIEDITNPTYNIAAFTDASGNVGIGTTAPGTNLDIKTSLRAQSANLSGFWNSAGLVMTDNSGNLYSNTNPSGTISLPSGVNGQTLRNSGGTSWVANSVLFNNGTNVGIGTTNSGSKLDVNGQIVSETGGVQVKGVTTHLNGLGIWRSGNTVQSLYLGNYDTNGNLPVIAANNADLAIGADNSGTFYDYVRIQNSTGNVGIGTTNPLAKLQVYGGDMYLGSGAYGGDWDTSQRRLRLYESNNSSPQFDLGAAYSAGTLNTTFFRTLVSGASSGAYTISVGNGNVNTNSGEPASYAEVFRIQNGGNVGIGNTNPTYKLDFATLNSSTDTNSVRLGVYNGPSGGGGTTPGGGIVWIPNYSGYTKRSAGILQIAESNYFQSGLAFYTNGTADNTTDWSERMRIASGGNVGIGTTAPGTNLDIKTSLRAQSANLSGFWNSAGLVMTDNSGNLYSNTNPSGTATLPTGVNGQTLRNSGGTSWVANSALFNNGTNVGIGTTAPGANLDIYNTGTALPAATGTAQSVGQRLRLGRDDGAVLDIGSAGTSGLWLQTANGTNLATTYPLLLNPNGGNVGIGAVSNNDRLAVQGGRSTFVSGLSGQRWSTAILIPINAGVGNQESETAPNRGMRILQYNSGTGGYGGGIAWGMAPQSDNTWLSGSWSSGQFLLAYDGGTLTLQGSNVSSGTPLTISPSTFVTFAATGNVGIGAAPGSYRLNVTGGDIYGSGNATLAGTTGLTLSGAGADLNFTGTGPNTITTASGANLALMPGGTNNVGIGTTLPGTNLDIKTSLRAQSANLSGFWNSAGLVMTDNSGNLYSNTNPSGTISLPTGVNGQTLRNSGGTSWVANSVLFNNGTNVGIGVTNPGTKLSVAGGTIRNDLGTTGMSLILTGTGSNFQIEHGGGSSVNILNSGGGGYSFRNSGDSSTLVQILDNGNVGIGTTVPQSKLDVNGNMEIEATSVGGAQNQIVWVQPGLSPATYGFAAITSDWNSSGGGQQGSLQFQTKGTSGSLLTRMWIDKDGNIGIGTSKPVFTLQTVSPTSGAIVGEFDGGLNSAFGGFGSYQNYIVSSEDFTTWPISGTISVAANSLAAPNGAVTADTITGSSNGAYIYYGNNQGQTGNATYVFSLWLRTTSGINSNVDLSIADCGYDGGGSNNIYTVTPTWQRFTTTRTFTPSGFACPVIRPGGYGSTGVVVAWGAQLEKSTVGAGTYARTSGTSLTSASSGFISDSIGNSIFNGNVGIGVIVPGTNLDIKTSLRAQSANLSGFWNSAGLVMTDNSGNLYSNTNPSGTISLPSGVNGQTLRNSGGTSWVANSVLFNNGTNVGIGTTAPSSLLQVGTTASLSEGVIKIGGWQSNTQGDVPFADLWMSNEGVGGHGVDLQASHYLDNWGSRLDILVGKPSSLGGSSNNSFTAMSVLGSGNVGIGTTNPGAALEADQTETVNRTDVKDLLIINRPQTTSPYNGSGISLLFKGSTYRVAGFNMGRIYTRLTDDSTHTTGANLVFQTSANDSTSTLADAMAIQYDGNVGIGTTNPQAKLQIGIPINAIGAMSSALASYAGTLGSTAGNTINVASLGFGSANTVALGVRGYRTASGVDYTTTALGLGMDVDNSSYSAAQGLWFSPAGNVGIGVTNPGAKLDISTSLRAQSANISGFWNSAGLVMTDNSGNLYSNTNPSGTATLPTGVNGQTLRNSGGTSWVANSALFNNGTNVGIGTTVPRAPLEVNANDGVDASIVAGNVIEVAGLSNVAQAADITITGGALVSGGPTAANGQGYWNITSFPSTITFNTRGWWTYAGMSFTAANAFNYPAGGGNKLPSNFLIEASSDGVTWVTVDNVTGYTSALYYKNNVYSGSGRYVRITATAPQSGETTSKIANVQIFNSQRVGKGPFTVSAEGNAVFMGGSVGINANKPLSTLGVLGNAAIGATYGLLAAPTSGLIVEGSVGIGVTNPLAKLSLPGGGGPAGQMGWLNNAGTSSNKSGLFLASNGVFNGGGATDYFGFMVSPTGYTNDFAISGSSDSSTHRYLRIGYNTSDDPSQTFNPVMSIDTYGGNVGIGTTGPHYPLEVAGRSETTSLIIGANNLVNDATGVASTLQFANSAMTSLITSNGDAYIYKTTSVSGGAYPFLAGNSGTLVLQPNATGDVAFVTGATPTAKMVIQSGGNVGIGVTNPGMKLDVSGWARAQNINVSTFNAQGMVMTDASGNLYNAPLSNFSTTTLPYLPLAGGTMSSGATVNFLGTGSINNLYKLTVNTIDPLYSINGTNYATFAASISGGVKEETVGKTMVDQATWVAGLKQYQAVINFDTETAGSDLWVWRRVIDFNKDNVEVYLTPYGGFAQVYYVIDGNKLIFRSDRPTEVSYRLIGKRFDWRQWPTKALDQTEKGLQVP